MTDRSVKCGDCIHFAGSTRDVNGNVICDMDDPDVKACPQFKRCPEEKDVGVDGPSPYVIFVDEPVEEDENEN